MTITEKILGWVGAGSGTRVETCVLDVELFDSGPRDAPVVLLLHGWPDDPSTWAEVWPTLNAAGLRTVIPHLRGFGGPRFRESATPGPGIPASWNTTPSI